jgi:hypothetical protein
MSVRQDGWTIRLEGACPVEEAEALTALLETPGPWTVDLSGCRQLHTALVQALLRYRPALQGTPDDPFLSRLVLPALIRAQARTPNPAGAAANP